MHKNKTTMKKSPSLDDVARLAQVSPGTVSRAISHPHLVQASTRERIQRAIDQLGYVPHGAARALALRRTATIGAVIPRLGVSFFSNTLQALHSKLHAVGYHLLIATPEYDLDKEIVHVRALVGHGIDGVVLVGDEHTPAVFSLLESLGIQYVLIWASGKSSDGRPCVGFDNHEAGRLIGKHLAEQGHQRVGVIAGKTQTNARARARLDGIRDGLAEFGVPLLANAIIETDYSYAAGKQAANVLLEHSPKLSAIACGNDYLALGVLSACDKAGLKVPEHISVTGLNDGDFAPFTIPSLTTVRFPMREIGVRAAEYLVGVLTNKPCEPLVNLPISLQVRQSTGPAPSARRKNRK